MTDGLKAEEEALPRGFILRNTIAALLIQSGLVFLTIFFGAMRRPVRLRAAEDFVVYFAVITGIAAAVSLPWAILAVWRFMRHGTPERSIKQIGSAVLDALQHEGSIDAASSEFRVYANRNQDGSVYCWIGGGTGRDQAIYV